MLFGLLSSNQLSAATNLYKGLLCHLRWCANNFHHLMGKIIMAFFSHFIMCLARDNFTSEQLSGSPTASALATGSLWCHRLHFRESLLRNKKKKKSAGLVSVSPGFLCTFVQPDATQNQLCALCFLNPDSAFALRLHFTGGLPYSGECVCFI